MTRLFQEAYERAHQYVLIVSRTTWKSSDDFIISSSAPVRVFTNRNVKYKIGDA